ncbi:hypothetical protein [Microseira sp. BLCC-F43]|jgi:hypothetical protein|uniref:hypothetical protein n=1 Tax=Microseira sp. BLCC-F43 TaxID=3153602 RepID=UPI0035B96AAF
MPMVDNAKNLVQEMKLESATAEVEKINARLECLQQLRTIEQKLEPIKSHPQVKGDNGILKKISNVRVQIDFGQEDIAKNSLAEIQQDVANLPSPTMMGQTPNYNLSEIVNSLKTAAVAVGNAVQSGVSKPVNQWLFWSQQVLALISGKEFRAQATYWFARPLFSLALLVGLSTVGLRSLYVQKGGTFGADPFSDYLGLILWGLSADVASRSLSDLAGGEEKKE